MPFGKDSNLLRIASSRYIHHTHPPFLTGGIGVVPSHGYAHGRQLEATGVVSADELWVGRIGKIECLSFTSVAQIRPVTLCRHGAGVDPLHSIRAGWVRDVVHINRTEGAPAVEKVIFRNQIGVALLSTVDHLRIRRIGDVDYARGDSCVVRPIVAVRRICIVAVHRHAGGSAGSGTTAKAKRADFLWVRWIRDIYDCQVASGIDGVGETVLYVNVVGRANI